jgi:hypothetical protein
MAKCLSNGIFHLQYWNLLSIELEVELGISYDWMRTHTQIYEFPRPFYRRIEKLGRLVRIGCLRSITISFIPGEPVKRDISDILRRGCHQISLLSWRYLEDT